MKMKIKGDGILKWVALIVAIVGGVPGLVSICQKYEKPRITVHFDKGHSFMAFVLSSKKEHFGKLALGCTNLWIVGERKITTFKDISCYLYIENNWYKGVREGLQTTNRIRDHHTSDPMLILGNSKDNIIVRDWYSYRPSVDYFDLKEGKVHKICVSFLFDLDYKKLNNISKMKFVIEDFLGNNYEYEEKFDINLINCINKNIWVIDLPLQNIDDVQSLMRDGNPTHEEVEKYLKSTHKSKT